MRVAIGLRLEGNEDWAAASDYVIEAERLGVDSSGRTSRGARRRHPAGLHGRAHTRIRLGSGIMQAGTRTPALIAMTAMSLASMSHDRFVLGLGVSGPQVIEGWHGIRFDRPVTRCARRSTSSRAPCGGERVAYSGRVYELPLPGGEGKALRSSGPPPRKSPSTWPRSRRAASR